jgi:hypothetical protein
MELLMTENGAASEQEAELEITQDEPTSTIPPAQQMANVSMKVPVSQLYPQRNGSNRPPLPAPRKASELTSKDFLEDMMVVPESINYSLAVHRFAPAFDEQGEEIKRGHLFTVPIMPLDSLHAEITQAWGGGQYRAVVVDAGGSPVISEKFRSAIQIQIPTTQVRPKNHRNEKPLIATTALATTPTSETQDRIKQLREQAQADELEYKANKLKRERELEDLRWKKEMRELSGHESAPGDAKIAALEAKLESVTSKLTDALTQVQKSTESAMSKIVDRLTSSEYQKSGDQAQNFMLAMSDSTNKLLGAIIPAMTSKNNDQSTDKVLENQRYMTELVLKVGQKDNAAQNQMMMALLNQAASSKEQFGPEFMLKLMTMGENRLKTALELVRGDDSGGDGDIAAALAGASAAEKMQSGWMGIVQNLMSNPAIAPVLGVIAQKFLGSPNPGPQHFHNAAQRLRPAMPGQQQPMFPNNQQFFTTPALPNTQPMQPQQQQQPQQFFTPQAATPATSPQGQQVFTPPPAVPQIAPMPQEVAGLQQTTAQEDATLPGEELEVQEGGDEAPETAEQTLKRVVTDSMRIALEDARAKPRERAWAQDAFSFWNVEFQIGLAKCQTIDQCMQKIADECDDDVWNPLLQILQSDMDEQKKFVEGIGVLVTAIRNAGNAQAQQSLQPQPAAPVAPPTPEAVPTPSIPLITPPPLVDQNAANNQAAAADLNAAM